MKKNKKDVELESLKLLSQAVRMDGWSNVLTGLGIKGRDKSLSSEVDWQYMVEHEAEHFYAGDVLARKIIDKPVKEALRNGYTFKGVDETQKQRLVDRAEELQVDKKVEQAWTDARIFGGAGIFKVSKKRDLDLLEKSMKPDEPLTSINVLKRYELYSWHDDIQKSIYSANFGEPKSYRFYPHRYGTGEESGTLIDATRIVRFDGSYLPERLYRQNRYWGDSELNKLKDAIRNYANVHDAVANIVTDISVAVFKIKNLANQIGSNDDQKVIQRLELVNLGKSVARAIILDAEGEDYEYKSRTFAGLQDLVSKAEGRLVTATEFPHTVLFGNSPSGLTSGVHEQNNWYDYIKALQKNYLSPRLIEIYTHICGELNINYDKLEIDFHPLWQLDEKEETARRAVQATTDQTYVDMGALDSSEVRVSRFGGQKYSSETDIDQEYDSVDSELT